MKKTILMLLSAATLFVACKKDEDDPPPAPAPTFSQTITGKWNMNLVKDYSYPGDVLVDSTSIPSGTVSITFNSNGTYSTISPFGNSTGNYSTYAANSKNYIVIDSGTPDADSNEVESYSSTSLVLTDRPFVIARGENAYVKIYLNK